MLSKAIPDHQNDFANVYFIITDTHLRAWQQVKKVLITADGISHEGVKRKKTVFFLSFLSQKNDHTGGIPGMVFFKFQGVT